LPQTAPTCQIKRFGDFELDLRLRELRKNGRKLRLQGQPIEILVMLLERPGDLVTRDEIQKRLWPNDTVVEFEHSIHAAINRLRESLGDAADSPRYVETLPRRGYRFLAAVQCEGADPASPEGEGPPAVGGAGAKSDDTNLVGKKVAHYRVLEVVGGGGMGVVYKAEDIKLGRRVALKFLPEEVGNDVRALGRFEREARAASSLNHPNICTIYEVEEHEGQPFIVMELLEGQTLRERIAAGAGPVPAQGRRQGTPLPIDELLDFGGQIAAGLDAAHSKGIIHRDIKPANIFLTQQGQAKILDFGLAKLSASDVPRAPGGKGDGQAPSEGASRQGAPLTCLQDAHLTRTGAEMGTASFMSPEQVRGEELDARTDLFSFGAVLYEMTTGRQAFPDSSTAVIHDAILNQTPTSPLQLNPELPLKLEEIICKALEKDRGMRYQSAADLRTDLGRLKRDSESGRPLGATSSPVTAAAVSDRWSAMRASPLKRRWALGLGIATLALAGVAAVLIGLNVDGLRDWVLGRAAAPLKIQSIAVLPLVNLSGDAQQDYFVDGMTEELIATLGKLSALRVNSRTSVMRYKKTDKLLSQVAKELNVDAVIEGSVLRVGNRVRITAELIQGSTDRHLWAETYDRDLRDVLALQAEVARAIQSEIQIKVTPPERARLATPRPVNSEAYDAYIKGRSRLCEANTGDGVTTAIKYFEKAIELDPTSAASYAGLADAYGTQGASHFLPPREAFPRAKAAAAKALALDENSAEAYATLCFIRVHFDWDWQAAERDCARTAELGPNSDAADAISEYYFLMGRTDEALALRRRSVERDPLSAGAHDNLGWGYFLSRRYDDAIGEFQKGLALDPMDSDAWEKLGHTYVEKRMYPQALNAYGREAALQNGSGEFSRAYVYARAGERDKALKIVEKMKQAPKRDMPPGAFAFIYTALGDKDQAFQWLEKAFEERDSAWFPMIKVSPMSDSLRSDPRFQDLMRRLNFPP